MNIKLRPATIDDSRAIWQVHMQAVRQSAKSHYDPTQIEARAGRLSPNYYRPDPDVFLVAETEDAGIVGFGEIDLGAGEIEAVFVDPRFGRRSIGRQLLERLEELAKQQGLSALVVDASLNAVTFYERAWYRQTKPTICV